MRKALIASVFAVAAVFATASHASDGYYYGDFYLDRGPPWSLSLYDNASGAELHLIQTPDACEFDGNDPEFRRVLQEDGLSRVKWRPVTECEDIGVYVCIVNSKGNEACTTWARGAAPH